MIKVNDLNVSFSHFSLCNISLNLPEGGCLAILGPSGAGKTLLLETVMGVRRPSKGNVLLAGRNVTDLPPEERRIAYIPQDLALFPHLSVRGNIVFGLPSDKARRHADAEVDRIAKMLRIDHLLARKQVDTLSGGEKQRVALARALIVRPRVLFLDEPFAALDAATSTELLRSFRAMRRDLNITVFLVTHNLDEAYCLADHVAIMMAGKIIESGPCDQVLRRPRTIDTARFLNIRNILPLTCLDSMRLPGTSTPGATAYAVRPEDITILLPSDASADCLPARLRDLITVGSHVIADLSISDLSLEASLSHSQADLLRNRLHKEVFVRFATDRVLYLAGRL